MYTRTQTGRIYEDIGKAKSGGNQTAMDKANGPSCSSSVCFFLVSLITVYGLSGLWARVLLFVCLFLRRPGFAGCRVCCCSCSWLLLRSLARFLCHARRCRSWCSGPRASLFFSLLFFALPVRCVTAPSRSAPSAASFRCSLLFGCSSIAYTRTRCCNTCCLCAGCGHSDNPAHTHCRGVVPSLPLSTTHLVTHPFIHS